MKDNKLNFRQASSLLNMSVRNLRRWVAGRFIPYIKVFNEQLSGQIFFSERSLRDFKGKLDKIKRKMDVFKVFDEDEIRDFRKRSILGELIEQELAIKLYELKVKWLSLTEEFYRTEDKKKKEQVQEEMEKIAEEEVEPRGRLEDLTKKRMDLFLALPEEEEKVEMEEVYKDYTGQSAMRVFKPKREGQG